MAQQELSKQALLPHNGFSSARIAAPWLNIARFSWLAFVSFTVVLCIAGLIIGYGQLREVCTGEMCHPLQLTPEQHGFNQELGLSLGFYAIYITLAMALFSAVCIVVGSLIFWHTSDNWIALFVSWALIAFGVGAQPIIVALDTSVMQAVWWQALVWVCGGWSLAVMLYIFPNGSFAPSWLRWVLLAWIVYNVIGLLSNPLPRAGIYSGPPSPVTQIMFIAGGLSQIYRYRHTPDQTLKNQTKWAVFGFLGHQVSLFSIITALTIVPSLRETGVDQFVFDTYVFAIVGLLPILFIPLSLAFCILRYGLWDIDVIIKRTLVYTTLTVVVLIIYVLIVGGLGSLFQTTNNPILSLIATGVVAVSFHTIRDRIQQTINRLIFGHRDEPHIVFQHLSRKLEPVVMADEILPTIARTIAEALRLPYVEIAYELEGSFSIAASYPSETQSRPSVGMLTLPLVHRSESIGQLRLAPRSQGESFSPSEKNLLQTIAHQVSIAAYNVRLTSDLQSAREKLVTTREEERRRIRRDLHDGLGPMLASMSFRLDAIHDLIDQNGESAKTATLETKAQVQTSLAEIRRIAYGLRPPALDELGLVGALQEHFTLLESTGGLNISFSAPTLPPLAAATEVAIYRIVMEAITNVHRHSGATESQVSLRTDKDVCLEVLDNGRGLSAKHHSGVGLSAMNERASELGGQCIIENRAGGGTRVFAMLPYRQES